MAEIAGNRLYLFCKVCGPDPAKALMLGKRGLAEYSRHPSGHQMADFFTAHAECGGGRDHFGLCADHSADWDKSTPVDPIAKAVRLSLV